MSRATNHPKRILYLLALSLALPACGSDAGGIPEEGNAYLTVVGDRNVFVGLETSRRLAVRYHDASDLPLAGEVSFAVVGDLRGSEISKATGVSNAQGIVELDVFGGSQDATFRIVASAEFAADADWNVSVTDGDPLPPLDPQGSYKLDSTFDVSQLPGDAGKAIGKFIDMTDDPNDPALWLLEQFNWPSWLSWAPAAAAPIVNGLIKDHAPGFVSDLIAVGDKMGQAARKFGTVSELAVTGDQVEGGAYIAVHTMTGFTFRIDSQTYEFSIDELGSQEPVIEGITFALDSDNVAVGEHDMPVRYGAFLGLALDTVVVPLVDPSVQSLHELFVKNVNCTQVGQAIYAEIGGFGIFTATTYKGLCDAGLKYAADAIKDQLIKIDQKAPLLLHITGEAKATDSNNNRRVDSLTGGKWTGSLSHSGDARDFSSPASFSGQRMTVAP
jgi:hypothetical protein